MSNVERQKLIENAMAHYRAAMASGEPDELKAALTDMENVYYAVCLWSVPGTDELRKAIISLSECVKSCLT